jgi:hypothetical protein
MQAVETRASSFISAGLKTVVSAILADVESWLPARWVGVAKDQISINSEGFLRPTFLPDGRLPSATAGRQAYRYIFRQPLTLSPPGAWLDTVLDSLSPALASISWRRGRKPEPSQAAPAAMWTAAHFV